VERIERTVKIHTLNCVRRLPHTGILPRAASFGYNSP